MLWALKDTRMVDGEMVAELPKCGEGDILLYRLIFLLENGVLKEIFFGQNLYFLPKNDISD